MRHPNLVKCYETGDFKGKRYILTEPVVPFEEGEDETHRLFRLAGLYEIGNDRESLNHFDKHLLPFSRRSIILPTQCLWRLGQQSNKRFDLFVEE